MQRVLLIDDEPTIREGLPLLIDWESLGYQIIATGKDGVDGLEKIRQLKPDLVITDIRMPGMDGLEMLKSAKEEGLTFHTIILSGFSEFAYAKEALVLGAVSYLLKPIDEEELEELLSQLADQVISQQEKNLYEQLVAKIFGNDATGLADFQQVMDIRLGKQGDIAALTQLLEASLKPLNIQLQVVGHHSNHHVILLSDQPGLALDLIEILEPFAQQQGELLLGSGWHCAAAELNRIYEEIRQLESYSFFYPTHFLTKSLLEEKLAAKKPSKKLEIAKKHLVQQVMEEEDYQLAFEAYWQLFVAVPCEEQEIKWRLQQNLRQMVTTLFQQNYLPEPALDFTESISAAEDIYQLKDVAWKNYQKIRATLLLENSQGDIVKRIEIYTQQHLADELSLKRLSELFNYNSTYLGKRFRQETGMGYSAYLEKQRMTKAKRLLQQTQLMVYEVAEKVGYGNNIDYFYKKFRRFYQASPNDFRGGEGV
ncbi:response regulator transcription factor [Enterococcus diestrammenae]|uniref:response regulator transcription factor n=1 Tax=Enterococcus diestrammenae TaxID=1155073 RepID=UPI00195C8FCD